LIRTEFVRRVLVSCATAALVAGIVSCGSSAVEAFIQGGLLTLNAVDGSPLPFRDATKTTLSGALDLQGAGHFVLTQRDSANVGGAITQTQASGDWTLAGNAVTLVGPSGSGVLYLAIGFGTIDSVRLNFGGRVNSYVRK